MRKPVAKLHAEIIAKIEKSQIGAAEMSNSDLLEWIRVQLKGSEA